MDEFLKEASLLSGTLSLGVSLVPPDMLGVGKSLNLAVWPAGGISSGGILSGSIRRGNLMLGLFDLSTLLVSLLYELFGSI